MNSFDIRRKFLSYFEDNGHTVVSSSSLIPAQDPTLLFTNAGMNQFKDCFLGKETRSYTRATSSQKCVRAGGKHNDLDQVGFTERHLTFFEMLGNFSFGDYFKKEAIPFAWNFLTKEMGLNPETLHISVYKDDQDSYDIWHKDVGIPEERIIRLGEVDNFWSMGDTGPCGPCTEIYLDRGSDIGCGKTTCAPGCECARFLEVWNVVFMQYNRQQDGSLKDLEQTGVDAGMGLERLCMILQGKTNVFDIDALMILISELEEATGINYEKSNEELKAAFRVMADHIRSAALLIADGCSPSNDGRGYVLRKIIRRAALFAEKLSTDQRLFSKLAQVFIDKMHEVWPELKQQQKLIIAVLDSEIDRFAQNLVSGQNILIKYLDEHKIAGTKELTGKQVFKLYDTYGFPPELTELIARDHNVSIDFDGFEVEMDQQKKLSGQKMKGAQGEEFEVGDTKTIFVGYESLTNTSVVQFVQKSDDGIWFSSKESPFFVETGGQVDDKGTVTINEQTFPVIALKKAGQTFKPAIMVKVPLKALDGSPAKDMSVGDQVVSVVDENVRSQIVKNHTATHMLQSALIQVLGSHVKQAGSIVHPDYLRFDYTHHKPLAKKEIKLVEDIVNNKIQENIEVQVINTNLKDAQSKGALTHFGDKYNPESVRMIVIDDYSTELCGGTHASRTGIIGCFKIISDSSLATGVRRIVALTGPKAVEMFQQTFNTSKKISEQFKVKIDQVSETVDKLQEQLENSQSSVKQLKKQLIMAQLTTWQKQITEVGKTPFLYLELLDTANDEMKLIAESLSQHKPGFYVLVNKKTGEQRFGFFAYASQVAGVDVNEFASWLKETFSLKGGGKAPAVQGGGSSVPEGFQDRIKQWVEGR